MLWITTPADCHNLFRCCHAVGHGGDQRDAHIARAGIALRGVACQKAAGQHLDGGFAPQGASEGQIVAIGRLQPNIERSIRPCYLKTLRQNRQHAGEFFLIQAAMLAICTGMPMALPW